MGERLDLLIGRTIEWLASNGEHDKSAAVELLRSDLARVTAERDEARCERDARVPLASLPTEYVCGEWIMAGQAEPDAVVTYASDPSPETGHVGWCWWARGKMGESRDYVAARDAAEKALRAHAAGSGNGGDDG